MHRRCLHASLTRAQALAAAGNRPSRLYARASSTSSHALNSATDQHDSSTRSDVTKNTNDLTQGEGLEQSKSSSKGTTHLRSKYDLVQSQRPPKVKSASRKKSKPKARIPELPTMLWTRRKLKVKQEKLAVQKMTEDEELEYSAVLSENDPVPGEWIPTPPKGVNPFPLKADLKRYEARLNADNFHSAMASSSTLATEEDLEDIEMSYLPGTLIENRKNNVSILAIVISEIIEGRRWVVQSLAQSGEIFSHSRADVHFAVPNFISADLAARCGTGFITQSDRELHARVEALKKLREGVRDIEASTKGAANWERQRAVDIYTEVRSNDSREWSKTTVKHVTGLLWTIPGFINYFAAHKFMMDNPLHFVASENYQKAQTFYVRPLRDVDEIGQVHRWVDDYRNDIESPVDAFVQKAKRVMKQYRLNLVKGPTSNTISQTPASYTWNEHEQIILRFLIKSMAPYRSNQDSPFSNGKHALLQLLAPWSTNLSDQVCQEVLVQLGVLAPWQNPWELTRHVNPMSDFVTKDPFIKAEERIAQRSLQNKAVPGAVLGPEDLHISDPLDSIRHDFGDMKVFVIDDATAQELDDGVSVERIPSEPGKYWVHAHIADPAAVIHPGHRLALNARERGSTLYLSHTTIPLLPKSLVHHPTLGLSLGQRSPEQGSLVLTFSAKLDMEGNFLAHKISAGIVREVRKITYDEVDDSLGLERLQQKYPFGRMRRPAPPSPDPLPEAEVADLKLLYQLVEARTKKRVAEGVFAPYNDTVNIDYLTSPPPEVSSPSMTGSVYQGYPLAEYSVVNTANVDTGSHLLVSEVMKLASRIASRVALEHDVLMVRRAVPPPIPASDESLQTILDARTWNGYLPLHKVQEHLMASPSAYYTLQPKGHSLLGIPDGEGYARATSPLRRFEDLVAHWNLHHILLGSKAPLKPPFNPSEMEQLCLDITTVEKTAVQLHKGDRIFSALSFIKREMDDKRTKRSSHPLETTLKAYKHGDARKNSLTSLNQCTALVPRLGLKVHIVGLTPDIIDAPMSTEFNVRIKEIILGANRSALNVCPA
ncbi:hypothetical protein CPB83DRAFT_818144 [Crepidotus variabilis]|uniref:RNB domain-containing protein n=1 Tax=Crepidotus variabilis TaxID=179855 RepID=A0A9P6EA79_9AGAR|nr:hypothetical protein CPB83DRAFT_818144 [Crepidotus variabilis]